LDIWQVPILPVVDFDGDGYVGLTDLQKVGDSWGQNDPSCDIGPMPWGDGVVDDVDLEILMYHWGSPESGLVAHWKLDEAEGTIADDSAGISDANLMGGPVWQPDGGMLGGALLFDGIDDYVKTPPIGPSLEGSPFTSFSVFAWVKGGAPGQIIITQILANNWLSVDPFGGYLMTASNNDHLSTQVQVTDGQWHRVGFVWDAEARTRTLYVDDVERASDTQSFNLYVSQSGLHFGATSTLSSGVFWSGLMDDVRIYNKAVKSPKQQRFRLPKQ
jgi:hypothetical protein